MIVLVGPIDTEKEMKAILGFLRKESHLARDVTNDEVGKLLVALKSLRATRLYGPIDTAGEVKLFLELLNKQNLLVGPIDTPEEVKIFMDKLRKEGILQPSNNIINNSMDNNRQPRPKPQD